MSHHQPVFSSPGTPIAERSVGELVAERPNLSRVFQKHRLDLDVRPIVARRRPPLPEILDAVGRLAPGQALRLTAPFEPAPLYAMLAERGFSHETSRGRDDAWVVVFRR